MEQWLLQYLPNTWRAYLSIRSGEAQYWEVVTNDADVIRVSEDVIGKGEASARAVHALACANLTALEEEEEEAEEAGGADAVPSTPARARRLRLVAGERLAIQSLRREGCRTVEVLDELRAAFRAGERARFDRRCFTCRRG